MLCTGTGTVEAVRVGASVVVLWVLPSLLT